MWKITDTRWLNPAHIAYVRDYPHLDTLTVYFVVPDHDEEFKGADRMRMQFLLETSRTDLEAL